MEVLSVKYPTKENLQFFVTSNKKRMGQRCRQIGWIHGELETNINPHKSISISSDDSDTRLFLIIDGCPRWRTRFAPALLSFTGRLFCNY